jgi:hypothetical protein
MNFNHDLWKHIYGFFDFDDVYRMIVEKCSNVVEIGGLLGKSTCFLGKAIQESGKRIQVVCIDPWPARFGVDTKTVITEPFTMWCANIKQSGWENFILPLRTTSKVASNIIRNGLAAVYIDGDHEFESVKQDIELWLPKVKRGGILAGHDYGASWVGVKKAVDATLGKVDIHRQSWVRHV